MNIDPKYFRFGKVSPLISHFVVFLATVSIVFDLIHLSVMPMKLSPKTLLMAVDRQHFTEQVASLHKGDSVILGKRLPNGSAYCILSGTKAVVAQTSSNVIVTIHLDQTTKISKYSQTMAETRWIKYQESLQPCQKNWTIQYG